MGNNGFIITHYGPDQLGDVSLTVTVTQAGSLWLTISKSGINYLMII